MTNAFHITIASCVLAVVTLWMLPMAQTSAAVVTVQVGASSDDAEEDTNGGSLDLTSTDLEINREGGSQQLVGMRFENIGIDPGDAIEPDIICSAYIQFEAAADREELTNLTIYAEDTDSANALSGTAGDISSRTPTTAQVDWSNVETWVSGNDYVTPDIATILEEIVDRPGWSNNNELMIIIESTVGSRSAISRDGAGNEPELFVEYDDGSGCASPASDSWNIRGNDEDAEESVGSGAMDDNDNSLELGWEGTSQVIGLRFNNITIPAGATINSASIRFTVDESDSDATSTTVYGQSASNPGTFGGVGNITGRTRTAASVDWDNIPAWNSVGASGADQTTPDLAAIVTEIVALGGWASGNSMVFILEGEGERTAESFNGSAGSAAELTIDYSVAVPGEANIRVSKTASADPVPTDTNFSYTVVVGNAGALDATDVILTDVLPGALTFVSAFASQGSCSETAGTVTCPLGTIVSGSDATVTIFVTSPSVSQTVTNNASVTASTPDSNTGDNSTSLDTEIGGNTDQLCYVFSDANNSLSLYDTAAGAITDFPANGTSAIEAIAWDSANSTLYGADANQLGVLDTTTGGWTARPSTFGTATTGALGAIALTDVDGLAFDPVGGNVMYGVHERTTGSGGDILFQIDTTTGAHIPGAFAGNDYVPLQIVMGNNITDDIAVDQTNGQMYATVNNGGSTDRLILVDKATGTATPLNLITIQDVEGLGSDPSGQLWGVSGTLDQVFEIDKATGVGSNPRALNFGDNEAVDCVGVSPTVSADLAIIKAIDDPLPDPGQDVSYTLTLTNNGASDATGVQVYDLLPPELTYVSDTPDQGIYDDVSGYWFVGSLASGGSLDLVIVASIDPGETLGTIISNTAAVSAATQPDADMTNNSSTLDATVATPILELDLNVSPATADPGEVVTYTITVTNVGNEIATDVVLDDELSIFGEFGFHTYGDNVHFDFTDSGSSLVPGTPEFDEDNAEPYDYTVPAGPAQVFDNNVTDWRLPMTGSMNPSNASFTIEYESRVN